MPSTPDPYARLRRSLNALDATIWLAWLFLGTGIVSMVAITGALIWKGTHCG